MGQVSAYQPQIPANIRKLAEDHQLSSFQQEYTMGFNKQDIGRIIAGLVLIIIVFVIISPPNGVV